VATSLATPTATATATPTPSPTSSRTEKPGDDERPEQREASNTGGNDDVHTEGNVVAVERTADGQSLLVTVAVTRGETVVVLVSCAGPTGGCPDVQVGDYVSADGYQNGAGDENSYFIASDDFTVERGGKRIR
jgi:hypothetical protein